jgi:hypothetical protein
MAVAEILRDTLHSFDLKYPEVDEKERARVDEIRALLEGE